MSSVKTPVILYLFGKRSTIEETIHPRYPFHSNQLFKNPNSTFVRAVFWSTSCFIPELFWRTFLNEFKFFPNNQSTLLTWASWETGETEGLGDWNYHPLKFLSKTQAVTPNQCFDTLTNVTSDVQESLSGDDLRHQLIELSQISNTIQLMTENLTQKNNDRIMKRRNGDQTRCNLEKNRYQQKCINSNKP